LRDSKVVVVSRSFGGESNAEEVKLRVRTINPGAVVQAFRPQKSSNSRYFAMIAAQTLVSLKNRAMLAKKAEMDFLLRVAGTAQISEAILKAGTKGGEPFVLVAAVQKGRIRGLENMGNALPSAELTEAELIGIERAAMLDAEKA
jgi:tRNA threonylcarbamoyladenosine modification (KEOPS) complex Cgi121 subunit